ncbi:MAG: NEW3 domain-containing protein [Candidatus Limnocylindrales bacterium]
MLSRRLRGLLSIAFALTTIPLVVPGVLAANGLTLTTPYPAVTVSPGTQATFELSLETTDPARIDLAVSGVPASWKATLHGGGYVVGAVQTDGSEATSVRLDVDVPEGATGSSKITVTATSAGESVSLALDIKVEADAGGEITVEPDYTALRGAANQSFTFNLAIANGTAEDVSYTATGEGPVGWSVDVTLTGQAQAVSGTAKAGGSSNVAVKVTPATNADAGTYKAAVVATVGGQQFPIDLTLEITGSYSLILSTPSQVLSANGPAGNVTEQVFTITNNGTAPITNVVLSGSLPTNWKAEYDPPTIATLAVGVPVTVTAKITPAADAISGDYSLTFTARGEEANDTAEIRFTVEASLVGALIGGGLIVGIIVGLLWVFRRYGRR